MFLCVEGDIAAGISSGVASACEICDELLMNVLFLGLLLICFIPHRIGLDCAQLL